MRARLLYKNGIKTPGDIKKSKDKVEKLLGVKVAKSIVEAMEIKNMKRGFDEITTNEEAV